MDARLGDVRDLAESRDHRLLLIVHGIEAGERDSQHQQRCYNGNHGASGSLKVRLFLWPCVLSARPAVSSVFIHCFILLLN